MKQADKSTVVWQRATLEHLDALYGFAMVLTHSQSEAEDLVQETYAHAARHCEQFRPHSNLKGWLFTIMRNIWLQQLRHMRTGPEFIALDDDNVERWLSDVSDDPQTLYVRIWEREEIRAALRSMPAACREMIVLRDIEGFSYKEIAVMLDCPLGTIMSRLARARAKLKRLLRARQAGASKKSDMG